MSNQQPATSAQAQQNPAPTGGNGNGNRHSEASGLGMLHLIWMIPLGLLLFVGAGVWAAKSFTPDSDDKPVEVEVAKVAAEPANHQVVTQPQPAAPTPPTAEEIAEMVAKAVQEAMKKEAEKPKAAVEAALPDPRDQQILELNAKIAQLQRDSEEPSPLVGTGEVEPLRSVNDHTRREGGHVVRRLGPEVQKDGYRWIPLFTQADLNSKETILVPVGKSVNEVYQKLHFEVPRPPFGQLAVFDIVREVKTGNAYSVFAWRLD